MKNISNQNNQTKSSFHRAHQKKAPGLVFQLWGMMMGLVALTAVFMWLVQVFLFEHTYAEAALSTSLKQMQPIMNDLTDRDLAEDDKLLPFLSRLIDGTIFLADDAGNSMKFSATAIFSLTWNRSRSTMSGSLSGIRTNLPTSETVFPTRKS